MEESQKCSVMLVCCPTYFSFQTEVDISSVTPILLWYLNNHSTHYLHDFRLAKFLFHTLFQVQTDLGAVYFDGRKRKDLFSSKGEEWKQRRHILTPAFSAHKMKLVMIIFEDNKSYIPPNTFSLLSCRTLLFIPPSLRVL